MRKTILAIGSNHVAVAIVQFARDGACTLLDFRERFSEHIERGLVADIGALADDVKLLLRDADRAAGHRSTSVDLLLTHKTIRHYTFGSSLYLEPDDDVITLAHVDRVRAQTQQVLTVPMSERILSAHVHDYTVNDLEGIRDPEGMSGRRLAVSLSLFSAPYSYCKNMEMIGERVGFEIDSWYPSALASVWATLNSQDWAGSVVFVHVGQTVSEVIGIKHHAIVFYETVEIGSRTVSHRLEEAHNLDPVEAVAFTQKYGNFGERSHGEEHLYLGTSDGQNKGYVSGSTFNAYLTGGTEEIVTRIGPVAREAQSKAGGGSEMILCGDGVRLGSLVEELEKVCESPISAKPLRTTPISHQLSHQAHFTPLLGRAILLREAILEKKVRWDSLSLAGKVKEKLWQWMVTHF